MSLRDGEYAPASALVRRERPPWYGETEWTPVPGPYDTLDSGSLLVAVDHPEAHMPGRAYDGDAGLDLFTSIRTVVPAGQFRDVPCGIRMQLPVGQWGRITGRSSTLRKRGLLVNDAVIDNGYVGPIYVGVWNLGSVSAVVAPGERIAQFILHEIVRVPVVQADPQRLRSRDGRGGGGFGSTGK